MFKQVKSALFWYYLYKFRKRFLLIIFLLLSVLFASSIYSDVIEYLKVTKQLEYFELVLILKWSIILINLTLIVYLILTIFKNNNMENKDFESKEEKVNKKKPKSNTDTSFTKREESFLYKKKLKSKADTLYKKN